MHMYLCFMHKCYRTEIWYLIFDKLKNIKGTRDSWSNGLPSHKSFITSRQTCDLKDMIKRKFNNQNLLQIGGFRGFSTAVIAYMLHTNVKWNLTAYGNERSTIHVISLYSYFIKFFYCLYNNHSKSLWLNKHVHFFICIFMSKSHKIATHSMNLSSLT